MSSLIAQRQRENEYLVYADGVEVGRIYRLTRSSVQNWCWRIYLLKRLRGGPGPWTGTADTFDLAKAAFRRTWEGEA